jgi:hypothetical protein
MLDFLFLIAPSNLIKYECLSKNAVSLLNFFSLLDNATCANSDRVYLDLELCLTSLKISLKIEKKALDKLV